MTEKDQDFLDTDEEMHGEAVKQVDALFLQLYSKAIPPETCADAAFEVSATRLISDWLIEDAKEWFTGIQKTFDRLITEEQERRAGQDWVTPETDEPEP